MDEPPHPRYNPCHFQKRCSVLEVDEAGHKQRIYFHTCSLYDADFKCAYPARSCHFKEEVEEFRNFVVGAALEQIADCADDDLFEGGIE